MQCIIRLDDITADMKWDRFYLVKDILDRYEVKPLIGVVPDCRDDNLNCGEHREDFWNYVKELQGQGWIISQHGTYHVYETTNAGLLGINSFSEFAGLSLKAQITKIEAGQNKLKSHGIFTDIFMAPGHSYDENTLRALSELGFRAITDGLYNKPYMRRGIMCVPCRLASSYQVKDFDTICLHTNTITDTMIEDLEYFLSNHRDEMVSFDVNALAEISEEYSEQIHTYEERALERRQSKKGISSNPRVAWYLTLTSHRNNKIKWLRRIIMLPTLLFYKGNEQ